ncbi:pantetheine-phosphate adenylyltransferase [Corynebacterium sp. 335C]
MRHAVCPGSFDPLTNGHLDVVTRAAAMFDRLTVLVTHNPAKQGLFDPQERMRLIRECVDAAGLDNVDVAAHTGLLVDWTTEHGATVLVKGVRSTGDYEYELPMAQMNRRLSGVETVFLPADPAYGHVSSTLMKEVVRYGGSIDGLVPAPVLAALENRLG